MRHTRYILLMTLLVAALTTQRVIAQAVDRSPLLSDLTQVVGGARQFARRLNRQEQRPTRSILGFSPRLTLRRLGVLIARLLDQGAPPSPVSPFLFRLPPPAFA